MLKKILFISLFFSAAVTSVMQANLLSLAALKSGAIEIASFLTKHKIIVIGITAVVGTAFVRKVLKEARKRKLSKNFLSAIKNNDTTKIRLALEKGADVNKQDSLGYFAIGIAAVKGYLDLVEFLLAKGADPNQKDNNGYPVLALASYKGHSGVVEFLLAKGADPNQKDSEGDTALAIAAKKEKDSIDLKKQKYRDIIGQLLAADAKWEEYETDLKKYLQDMREQTPGILMEIVSSRLLSKDIAGLMSEFTY